MLLETHVLDIVIVGTGLCMILTFKICKLVKDEETLKEPIYNSYLCTIFAVNNVLN